ncbi:nuclear transport factor 2 family protein [Parasphingorhabdus sp.]|uniref:nuclear transport factor 2 family protein n=1 Tax=Parasphingorhabdus sp. TaxID=2709688 RepID=UPI003A936A73
MDEFTVAAVGVGQLHARFVDAVFRQDIDEFAQCFASNGVWKIAGMQLSGRETIHEAATRLLGLCEKIQLIAQTPILEVEGSTAQGRQQIIEFAKMPDGTSAMTFGVYHDRYVLEDGRWRFAKRHWSFKYRGPADLSAAFVDTPDYGAFPDGPSEDETTYVRTS